MTARQEPPTGASLGRQATLYHAVMGSLDRVKGPQKTDGARFYAGEVPVDEFSRIIVEYPDNESLAAAWEDVLFASPTHMETGTQEVGR